MMISSQEQVHARQHSCLCSVPRSSIGNSVLKRHTTVPFQQAASKEKNEVSEQPQIAPQDNHNYSTPSAWQAQWHNYDGRES